jgi:hypothetical protein
MVWTNSSISHHHIINFFHQWFELILTLIQVDIGGHPPTPTGSKQSSGNLLFLAVFRFLNFWGHFEGLNEVFFGLITSMIFEGSH